MNSSPPLISWKFQGIRWNLGEIGETREISGKFRGTQWNSVWRLVWIQWEFLGDFGATPGFQENLEFGAVSGDLGASERLLRK